MSPRDAARRAVFMDRDGTVADEVGYVNHASRLRLLPGSAAALRRVREAGLLCVVVTNQSGVARDYFEETVVNQANERFRELLAAEGASVDAIYYCPHHPTEGSPPYVRECDCRKPATGLIFRAAEDLNVDLRSSYMIGDHFSDIECGQRAGAKTVLLLTGHGKDAMGKRQQWPRPPSHIAADLYDAVQWVLNHPERE